MSGQNYDSGQEISYRFAAATLTAAAVVGRLIGPAGKIGRVTSLTSIVTTGVTVAAAVVDVDTVAGITTPVTLTVPISSANAGASATKAVVDASTELPADTVVQVSSDGGPTAGAADLVVTVTWY